MHFMNKQRGAHMGEKPARSEEGSNEGGASKGLPSIQIQSHEKGHTVHINHADGRHEKHEHESGDAEGIAAHIHQHIGGAEGQNHGYSSGEEMEDEHGYGSGV